METQNDDHLSPSQRPWRSSPPGPLITASSAANSRLIGRNQYWTVQGGRSQPAGDCAPFRYRGDADPRSQRYDCAGAAEARHSGPYPFSDAAARRAEGGHCRVNLAELRLYYFPPGENQVQVHPLGIGQLGLETPEMTTRVGQEDPQPYLDAYRRHPRALAGERG